MKKLNGLYIFILSLFFVFKIFAQTLITFDNQGWGNDQTLSSSFTIDILNYSSNEDFYTNYGYNFDVNSNSLYYVFQNADSDKITITTVNNSNVDLNSIDAYQVSETSTDTLVVEGWNGSTKMYSKSFSDIYSWKTLNLGYSNINKITIKLSPSGSNELTDYNFDNFSFNATALPVELTTFTASAEENGITLQWKTATETNNYGFDIERSTISTNSNVIPNGVDGGIDEWNKIGFVNGAGNSNSTKSYTFTDTSAVNGKKYKYRLKQIDYNGSYIYSNTVVAAAKLKPSNYTLSQNYPNPFNPSTKIDYRIPEAGHVVLKVYDILGNEVATLVDGNKLAGSYSVSFNASNLASGIYVYVLRTNKFTASHKMILMK